MKKRINIVLNVLQSTTSFFIFETTWKPKEAYKLQTSSLKLWAQLKITATKLSYFSNSIRRTQSRKNNIFIFIISVNIKYFWKLIIYIFEAIQRIQNHIFKSSTTKCNDIVDLGHLYSFIIFNSKYVNNDYFECLFYTF